MADTSFDLTNAGVFFRDAGISINERVQENLQTLDFHQIQELSNKAQELFIKSKTMFAQSVILIGEEAKTSFQSLQEATLQINDVIRKVKKVQSLIDFATKLVSVASAILSGDILKIISNGRSILNDIHLLVPAVDA